MSVTSQQILQDYAASAPDASVIAKAWVNSAKGFKSNVPAQADLAEAITGIGTDLTMQGAPELEIDIYDPQWNLLDSGFFDPSGNGRLLDKIEINYPQGSRYHWRLFQFSPQQSGPFQVQTYWIPRVVDDLMSLKGPFSASRASRTRAEFLKMCTDKVPYAHFYSKQLTVIEPIANVNIPTGAADQGTTTSGGKTLGVSADVMKKDKLTVKGQKMTDAQRGIANILLQVADQQSAGQVATEALIYAGIWESGLNPQNSNGKYWGVLSAGVSDFQQSDTVGMATAFLLGQKDFSGAGGAIAAARSIANPVQIAVQVEVPSIWPSNSYATETGYPGDAGAISEVDKIIQAGGGATGTGGVASGNEVVQQYNFTIGTTDSPHEDYWTGMNRLAQEVNWELVVDGDDVYYDSDVTMTRYAIDQTIDRTDQAVLDAWTYDWSVGGLVTNFQLPLICDPLQFRPADVFRLYNFGPASDGSTIKLPGRWLVGEIQRNPGDIFSTFTLVQPTQPLKEPAPTISNSGSGGSAVVGAYAPGSVLAAVQASQQLSNMKVPYVYGGLHGPGELNITSAGTLRADGMDCSSSVSWVLHQAGMLDSNGAIVSGAFETWGEPGPGEQMTIWCASNHVYIEFNVPNIGHMQMNTSYNSANGLGNGSGPQYFPWGQEGLGDSESFVARHWKDT